MIGESIDQHWVSSVRHQRQGIASLKVALASCRVRNLPCRYGIAAKWIVHPFRNFVAHWRNVRQAGTENSLFHPACPYKGLYKFDLCHLAYVERRMEAKHTAFLDVFLRRKKNIRSQGDGQCIRRKICHLDHRIQLREKKVSIDDRIQHAGAGIAVNLRIASRDSDSQGLQELRSAKNRMPILACDGAEFRPLHGITKLCGPGSVLSLVKIRRCLYPRNDCPGIENDWCAILIRKLLKE